MHVTELGRAAMGRRVLVLMDNGGWNAPLLAAPPRRSRARPARITKATAAALCMFPAPKESSTPYAAFFRRSSRADWLLSAVSELVNRGLSPAGFAWIPVALVGAAAHRAARSPGIRGGWAGSRCVMHMAIHSRPERCGTMRRSTSDVVLSGDPEGDPAPICARPNHSRAASFRQCRSYM